VSEARKSFTSGEVSRQSSVKEESQPTTEALLPSDIAHTSTPNKRSGSLRNPRGKSLSLDAVYIWKEVCIISIRGKQDYYSIKWIVIVRQVRHYAQRLQDYYIIIYALSSTSATLHPKTTGLL